jgi:hypothetical protein
MTIGSAMHGQGGSEATRSAGDAETEDEAGDEVQGHRAVPAVQRQEPPSRWAAVNTLCNQCPAVDTRVSVLVLCVDHPGHVHHHLLPQHLQTVLQLQQQQQVMKAMRASQRVSAPGWRRRQA